MNPDRPVHNPHQQSSFEYGSDDFWSDIGEVLSWNKTTIPTTVLELHVDGEEISLNDAGILYNEPAALSYAGMSEVALFKKDCIEADEVDSDNESVEIPPDPAPGHDSEPTPRRDHEDLNPTPRRDSGDLNPTPRLDNEDFNPNPRLDNEDLNGNLDADELGDNLDDSFIDEFLNTPDNESSLPVVDLLDEFEDIMPCNEILFGMKRKGEEAFEEDSVKRQRLDAATSSQVTGE